MHEIGYKAESVNQSTSQSIDEAIIGLSEFQLPLDFRMKYLYRA